MTLSKLGEGEGEGEGNTHPKNKNKHVWHFPYWVPIPPGYMHLRKKKKHVWHFPYLCRGKGSHIGVEVRAWVSQRTPWDQGSGFQSLLGTCI